MINVSYSSHNIEQEYYWPMLNDLSGVLFNILLWLLNKKKIPLVRTQKTITEKNGNRFTVSSLEIMLANEMVGIDKHF